MKWPWIEQNTKPPYYLTQKENGCIIFISGLPDGNLLVCSKHSTGSRSDSSVTHSEIGERWIEKHLAKTRFTKQDLAATLRSLNCTAVAELCDDSFEEHILEYQGERAGLYLHGLNLNLPQFVTYPFESVCQFAEIFGLKPTKFTVIKSYTRLRSFLDECAETGAWEGCDVEGFVVRSKALRPNTRDAVDYFFKYKFEEPYLMYRGWREATKRMLTAKPVVIKKHKKITEEYLKFARSYFRGRNDIAEQYLANHGIITARDKFLKSYGKAGAQIIKDEEAEDESEVQLRYDDDDSVLISSKSLNGNGLSDSDYKYVIVPVATIGCGKTTLSLVLEKLFGWGHIQNDNIARAKGGTGRRFCEALKESLLTRTLTIADRNNHMRREREQIYHDMNEIMPNEDIRYIALHFVHDGPAGMQAVREVTLQRVLARGDNHQTIKSLTDGEKKTAGIMNGFLNRFQAVDMTREPDKDIFDLVINLQVDKSLKNNLDRIISTIADKYSFLVPERPSDQEIDDAISYALNYVPPLRNPKLIQNKAQTKKQRQKVPIQKIENLPKTSKKKKINYIALKIPEPQNFATTIRELLTRHAADLTIFNKLMDSDRIQSQFHVTIMHVTAAVENPDLWEFYVEGSKSGQLEKLRADVVLNSLIWNDRVMCAKVNIMPYTIDTDQGPATLRLQGRQVFHITIGTVDSSIKPAEAYFLLKALESGEEREVQVCDVSDDDIIFFDLTPVPCS